MVLLYSRPRLKCGQATLSSEILQGTTDIVADHLRGQPANRDQVNRERTNCPGRDFRGAKDVRLLLELFSKQAIFDCLVKRAFQGPSTDGSPAAGNPSFPNIDQHEL
jgi:hypothetical protein